VSSPFLNPLTHSAEGACDLINERTGQVVARAVEAALTSETRRRGLLGRDGLPEGAALLIAPCPAIHTFSMRFAIDVVFVDGAGTAVHVVRDLQPWRIAIAPRAFAVIEMAAGALARREVARGDRLTLRRSHPGLS